MTNPTIREAMERTAERICDVLLPIGTLADEPDAKVMAELATLTDVLEAAQAMDSSYHNHADRFCPFCDKAEKRLNAVLAAWLKETGNG